MLFTYFLPEEGHLPRMQLTLQTVGAAFIQGADSRGTPELRVPSLRGQLRYWGRSIWGARYAAQSRVWDQESAIFGSTGIGSRVLLRLTPLQVKPERIVQVAMLPHKQPGDRGRSPTNAIKHDVKSILTVATRPGEAIPEDFNMALSLFLLLGGFGKRSRRMFGGLQAITFDAEKSVQHPEWWLNLPRSPQEHAAAIRSVLNAALPNPITMNTAPAFPTLHPRMSWILVGEASFDSAEEANVALFRQLLRNEKYRPNQNHFGYAMGNRRRASPLIAQVRKSADRKYYPVLTYMRSRPEENGTVRVINDFLGDAKRLFNAELVWGGELS